MLALFIWLSYNESYLIETENEMNPVAKNCYKFNKPKVERNRKAYSRTIKHKHY